MTSDRDLASPDVGLQHFAPTTRIPTLARHRLSATALSDTTAIVLFCGGAGTGKTVAAASAATALADVGAESVWVRFRSGDEAADRLWSRLLSALSGAGAIPAGSTLDALCRGGTATARSSAIADALADALARRRSPLVLLLDDLHHAADDEALGALVDVLAESAALRLIATSRRDLPVLTGALARARLGVHVVGEDELAFTAAEITELLRVRVPELDEESIPAASSALHRESRGWPLATSALIAEQRSGRLSRPQSHGRFIRSYVERLLRRRDHTGRRMLLASALLSETSPALLAGMLSCEEADALLFYERLDEGGLTYWEDGDGVRWYRHHDLIREELARRARVELAPAEYLRLHRRAGTALRETRPREATQAAIVSEAWGLLTELLLTNPMQSLLHHGLVSSEEHRLRNIPQHVRDEHPVIGAFALFDEYLSATGRFQQSLNRVRLALGPGLAAAAAKPGLPGAVAAVLRMTVARLGGHEELSVRMAVRALEGLFALPTAQRDHIIRAIPMALSQLTITFLYADRFDDAERSLTLLHDAAEHRVLQDGPDAHTHFQGAAGAVAVADHFRSHAAALAAFSAAWRGDMPLARQRVALCESRRLPVGWHDSYIGAGYRLAAALCELDRAPRDPDALAAAATHRAALAPHEATIEHWPYLIWIDATIAALRHGPVEALSLLAAELDRDRRRGPAKTTPRRHLLAIRERLRWLAWRTAAVSNSSARPDLADVYTGLAARDPVFAQRALNSVLNARGGARHPRVRVEALLLQAMCALDAGDESEAAASARLAVDLASRFQLNLPFCSLPRDRLEALSLLASGIPVELGHCRPAAVRDGAALLSPAELRALQGIADHQQVAVAARALSVSAHTIRQHLKSVYRKLGVHNRADALRAARTHGILAEPTSGPKGDG